MIDGVLELIAFFLEALVDDYERFWVALLASAVLAALLVRYIPGVAWKVSLPIITVCGGCVTGVLWQRKANRKK